MRTFILWAAISLLTACGGGGSGAIDPPVDPPPPPPPPAPQVGLSFIAGSLEPGVAGCGVADGPGDQARFSGTIMSMTVSSHGEVYLGESYGDGDGCTQGAHATRVRKVSVNGQVSTLAYGDTRVGDHTLNSFFWPFSLAVAEDGVVFVSDAAGLAGFVVGSLPMYLRRDGQHVGIWMVSPEGQVSALAGVARGGQQVDGQGSQAQFFDPVEVFVHPQGGLLVRETGRMNAGTSYLLRRVTEDGTVTTQGPADDIGRIIADPTGALYALGWSSGAYLSATLTNLATGQVLSNTAPNTSARMAMDRRGRLYVAYDSRVQYITRWTPDGGYSVVLGQTTAPSDGPIVLGDLPGRLRNVQAIAIGPNDELYIMSDHALLKAVFE